MFKNFFAKLTGMECPDIPMPAPEKEEEKLEIKSGIEKISDDYLDKEELKKENPDLCWKSSIKSFGQWAKTLEGVEGYAVVSSGAIALQEVRSGGKEFKVTSDVPPGDMDMLAVDLDTLKHMRERLANDENIIFDNGGKIRCISGDKPQYALEGVRLLDVNGEKVAEPFEIFVNGSFAKEEYKIGVENLGVDKDIELKDLGMETDEEMKTVDDLVPGGVRGLKVLSAKALQHGYEKRWTLEGQFRQEAARVAEGLETLKNDEKYKEVFEKLKNDLERWNKEKNEIDWNNEDYKKVGIDRLKHLSPQVLYDFYKGKYNKVDESGNPTEEKDWAKLVKAFSGGKRKWKASRAENLEALRRVQRG